MRETEEETFAPLDSTLLLTFDAVTAAAAVVAAVAVTAAAVEAAAVSAAVSAATCVHPRARRKEVGGVNERPTAQSQRGVEVEPVVEAWRADDARGSHVGIPYGVACRLQSLRHRLRRGEGAWLAHHLTIRH
eukprot:2918977-Pleurochrysis_carterae.AAC.1